MPRRLGADQLEWDMRKEDILKLYVEQNEPLPEVILAMARQGFKRTKPQYERSFKRWRISKNVRGKEWEFILGRLNERNRPTKVKVRGVTISQTRIELQRVRQRDTTLDRCISRFRPQPRSRTPEDIEISSPPPELSRDDAQISETPDHDSRLREQPLESSGDLIECPRTLEQDPSLSPGTDNVTNVISTTVPEAECEYAEVILAEASILHSPQCSTTASSSSRPLCECIRQYILDFNWDYVVDESDKQHILRYRQSSMDHNFSPIGYPVLMIFVNHTEPQIDLRIIARDTDNKYDLLLLQSLLICGQHRATWVAFSFSLLHSAMVEGNLPLLNVVSETGIDVDARQTFEHMHKFSELTPLQFAVLSRHKDMIECLSRRGATILTASMADDWEFLTNAHQDMDLLQPLLARLAASGSPAAGRGISLLAIAVAFANLTLIDVLLKAGFSPYLSTNGSTDFSRIVTFDEVSQRVRTPFLVAFNMYRENCVRVDENPMSEPHRSVITKLLSFSTHNLDEGQRSSQLHQVALAYAFAGLAKKYELETALYEMTGFGLEDIERTIRDRRWDLIRSIEPIPCPWAALKLKRPGRVESVSRLERW